MSDYDEETAYLLDRALADLEMIQAAYPDEIAVAEDNRPDGFPLRFALHLSESASITMELPEGYPVLKGIKITDYRTTKHSEKLRLDGVLEAVRATSIECLAEEMEGSIACCAAAIEAWNDGYDIRAQDVVSEEVDRPRNEAGDPLECTQKYSWISGDPLVDKKSTFQAHLCSVKTEEDVTEALRQLITGSSKLQRATHNMYAWRIVETLADGRVLTKHDNDDDGEDAAGSKLAYLLDMRNDENVLVVVSRWYGGIQLGPKRFAHIVNVARELLVANPPQVRASHRSTPHPNQNQATLDSHTFLLSARHIEEYLENGVLVVDDVLTPSEVARAQDGFHKSLRSRGVCSLHEDDKESALAFDRLSSTNGSGGVLDIFYDDWKMLGVATNTKLFRMTTELWKAAYNQGGSPKYSLSVDQQYQWHPYGGDIDYDKGYVYIDRLGYRLPTALSQSWGDRIHPEQKKKKLRAMQRSLTPHLDCCPDSFFSERASKWRPIQCFVSLTDNLEPNTGGFEAAAGFHREFDLWAKQRSRPPSRGDAQNARSPSLCVGDYTHIRPKEDEIVMKRVRHIPVKAGSAVFWDNRIPHANSYRNDSDQARMVVYCSFLPDISLNRRYVMNQLHAWRARRPITDQWNQIDIAREKEENELSSSDHVASHNEHLFSDLGRKLMGITPW
ncbi:UPF0029 domain containing protein [Nitzschia inconspicua]|uniref:UPF0029 domain containing protein n=1 Tax=Nitzschia inconspicua TaxID=303405 RepID=A0A9K3M8X0_9STRA|nr:UPF0029 domain containing protein [Nitzschia inconspicua]